MSQIIAAVFPDLESAHHAVHDLQAYGVPLDRVSILSHQSLEQVVEHTQSQSAADEGPDGIGQGVAMGAAGGAVAGAVVSLALAAVPGIGWILAAGPLLSVLSTAAIGAGAGAAAGGLNAALSAQGLGDDADVFVEAVRRGGTVVMLEAASSDCDDIERIMGRHDLVDIDLAVERWREQGWTRFDPSAEPFSRAQSRAERDTHAEGARARGPRGTRDISIEQWGSSGPSLARHEDGLPLSDFDHSPDPKNAKAPRATVPTRSVHDAHDDRSPYDDNPLSKHTSVEPAEAGVAPARPEAQGPVAAEGGSVQPGRPSAAHVKMYSLEEDIDTVKAARGAETADPSTPPATERQEEEVGEPSWEAPSRPPRKPGSTGELHHEAYSK